MTQDFAKQHRTGPPPSAERSLPRGTWFLAGFVLGAFVSFLGALWYFVPTADPIVKDSDRPVAEPEVQAEEMQWDFYEIFPRSVVPVVEEYAEDGQKVVTEQFAWILQAGSFVKPEDADEMRAELILLGLDVTISSVVVKGQDRHRVIVGPFDTELARNRAQDRLAQAQIESLAIKIPR